MSGTSRRKRNLRKRERGRFQGFDQPERLPPIISDPLSTFRLARTNILLEMKIFLECFKLKSQRHSAKEFCKTQKM